LKDTFHSFVSRQAIVPAVKAAAENGTTIDLQGFGSALFSINTGAIASAGDFGVKLQESNTTTSGDFTDVAAGDMLGGIDATLAENTTYDVGYTGRKRYVRLAVTKAGGTSIALGAVAVLGHAAVSPI
jgi:hypothetical protein